MYINGIHLLSSVSGSMHTAFSCFYCGVLSPRLCSIQAVFSQTSQPSLCYLQLAFNSWVSVSVSSFTKVAEKSISACPYHHLFSFPIVLHLSVSFLCCLFHSDVLRRLIGKKKKNRFRLGKNGHKPRQAFTNFSMKINLQMFGSFWTFFRHPCCARCQVFFFFLGILN